MTIARKITPTGIIPEPPPPPPRPLTREERIAERRRALRIVRSDKPTRDFVTTLELAARYGYTSVRIGQIMVLARCFGWRQNIGGKSQRVYPREHAHHVMREHCEARRHNDD